MSKDFSRAFYSSEAWNRCRDAYKKSVGGLCEVCLANGKITPGEIIHHRTPLTPENIHNNHITLDWNNLECVCRECHAIRHGKAVKRYKVDALGRVVGTK